MRQLLRRVLAIAIASSVVLSMLGLAFAPCDGRGGAAARGHASGHGTVHARRDMAAAADHDASTPPDCAHDAPPGRDGGAAPCLLVAHCVSAMPAPQGVVVLATAPADARLAPAADARPLTRALEIDSPPPRG
jgi:hypothetical protein